MSYETKIVSNLKNEAPISVHSPSVATTALPDVRQVSPRSDGLRLERESSSWRTLVLLSSASVGLDVGRQVSSYAIKYYNTGAFPVPPSALVFVVELAKMAVIMFKMCASAGGFAPLHNVSFAYLVPSTLYALNNNIYYVALRYTTPAVWNILMQCRLMFIALVYRFYFKKAFTGSKWLAIGLLLAAIITLQFSGSDNVLETGLVSWRFLVALGLALLASIFAAVGPVFTEYLLKHEKRPFDEKQLQIYMFGSLVTGLLFSVDFYTQNNLKPTPLLHVTGSKEVIHSLILSTITCSVVGGIVVANIIKKLDNIVKLYAQAVSGALTAIASAVLFPAVFQFDVSYIVSFMLTIAAIYLYEAPDPWCQNRRKSGEVAG